MAWTDETYKTAFDAEAGDISSLATASLKVLWFNEGMARLLKKKPASTDITWAAAARSVALPSTFIQLDKIVPDEDSSREPWRVWGETLVLDDPEGASAAGGARVYYWGEWTPMVEAPDTATELTVAEDYACLYYALSRFYRRLSSNRAYYKRYATLVGQNAVSMTDLQDEADRYLQDFLDSRADLEPTAPGFFYEPL